MAHNKQKVHFLIVGVFNTVIDFTVFFSLSLIIHPIVANLASTTCAFTFSFFANRRYTFPQSHNGDMRRQISLFLIVTLIALWILQPIVIALVLPLMHQLHSLASFPGWLDLLTAKSLAVAVSLIWNYIWYSRYVFRSPGARP